MGAQLQTGPEWRGVRPLALARRAYLDGQRAPVDVSEVTRGLEGDRALPLLADAQHGVAHCHQLNEIGLDHSAITRRKAGGLLHRIHLGVYAIGRTELTREGTLTAAVLAYPSPSLLAGRSALEVWGALPPGGSPCIVSPKARSRPGIRAIDAAIVLPADLCALNYLPLTAPARSLLDFAPRADPYELETALNELRAAKLLRLEDLDELKLRTHGHHGWGPLNRLLAAETEPGFSRKEAELRLLRLIRAASLPSPGRNVRVGRWEVDFLWAEARLVVEVDSYAFHSSRRAFERDRRKQAELQRLGLEVLRFTWRQITTQPEWVIAQIAARLAARSSYFRKPS
jgi:very-short-patch-repair endonuclease